MAEDEEEPTVEVLNSQYPFVGERQLVKITYPPGTCTKQTYTSPYVVLAATAGNLTIEINGEEQSDLTIEPGQHYAREAPDGNGEFTIKVCNNSDIPIIIFKA